VHLTSSPIDWYAARAGGVVAYVLLTTGVLLGLTMASRRRLPAWPRVALEDVHRYVGLLTGTFIAIHVVTIAIDSYLPFSLTSLVVPFIAHNRALWTGLGIVAAELLIALAVTNRLRNRRLSQQTWRRAHYLNFAVWTAATVHGLGSGTDRSTPWLLAIEAIAIGSVVALTGWRLLHRRVQAPRIAIALPAGLGAAAALAAVALASGPLRFHPKPWNAARFSEALAGHVERQTGSTRGLISLAGTATGTQKALVRADLLIAPGRLLSTAFQMEYLPSGETCRGTVTHVDQDGLGFAARCRLRNGPIRQITARWLTGQGTVLQGGTITSA
jgi:sulfoxide reductase heme-binding subunit YedZ